MFVLLVGCGGAPTSRDGTGSLDELFGGAGEARQPADELQGVDWQLVEGEIGIGRSVSYPVTHLEPSAGQVADRAFVFVPTTMSTARAVFEPADKGPAELMPN